MPCHVDETIFRGKGCCLNTLAFDERKRIIKGGVEEDGKARPGQGQPQEDKHK